jgi:hypothetical protein
LRGLLVFLPILHLAAGQITVTASATVAATLVSIGVPTATVAATLVSTGVPTATSIPAIPSIYDPSESSLIVEPLSSSLPGVSVFTGGDSGDTATTTIDFSIITANGTVVTLTATGTVTPSVHTSSVVAFTEGGLTTSTRTTGGGTGTATGTQSLIANFTNAAPAGDSAKLGLGFLGFAGAVIAVGL